MQAADYVQYIAEQIHTVVLAAADERGRPAACATGSMDRGREQSVFSYCQTKNAL